ncbi:MAG: hypothetical protein ACK5XN_05375, partial [Bacteroidota bacterium]
ALTYDSVNNRTNITHSSAASQAGTAVNTLTGLLLTTTGGTSTATVSGDVSSSLAAGMPISGNPFLAAGTVVTTVAYNELNHTTTIGLSANALSPAFSLSTTAGQPSATVSGNVAGSIAVGARLSGNSQIPAGAFVTSITYNTGTNTTTLGLSSAATGTQANISTTFNGTSLASSMGSYMGGFVQQSFTANTTSGSNTITLASGTTNGFFVGMPVSGTGIPANSTVASINANGTQFTISANATANGTGVSVTANSGGTTAITNSTAGLYVGMPVSGPGIPANSTVQSILSATTFTLSSAVTSTGSRPAIYGVSVPNGAVTSGNLIIGNVSLGGLGSTVVHLGGSEQIANNT